MPAAKHLTSSSNRGFNCSEYHLRCVDVPKAVREGHAKANSWCCPACMEWTCIQSIPASASDRCVVATEALDLCLTPLLLLARKNSEYLRVISESGKGFDTMLVAALQHVLELKLTRGYQQYINYIQSTERCSLQVPHFKGKKVCFLPPPSQ